MSAAPGRRGAPSASMSIGAVMAVLRPEFPDISISKIRFLEDQGLIEPQRTPSGYRKFSRDDIERLRYVLSAQRDHYLPLRVIRDHLEALDQGAGTSSRGSTAATARPTDRPVDRPMNRPSEVRLTRAQLLSAAGIDGDLLDALIGFGLVQRRPGTSVFDGDALTVARVGAALAGYGIEPRHLRAFRGAADREAGLVEQVVLPLRRQRDPDAAARADEVAREVAGLCVQLHAALVKAALDGAGS